MTETIFAISTGNVRAGVAVIRVSGPAADEVCVYLAGRLPEMRKAVLCGLRDPASGDLLDMGLVIRFPDGGSFTGEPSVEFQIHGSRATTRAVLAALSRTGVARLAEPGEFTRRALENGALDLAQVEALSDLIEAETEAQRKQALRVLDGELGRKVGLWREGLLQIMAQVAVTIDFADEEVPEDTRTGILALSRELLADFQHELEGAAAARRVREGFEVAIIGAPNVGKSTLLNNLAGRDVAITSDIAGTTRDVLEVSLEILGHTVVFLDTAGLRSSDDVLEAEGVRRARDRAKRADLRVFLVESREDLGDLGVLPREGDLVLGAKGDKLEHPKLMAVSGRTGEGVDGLLSAIGDRVAAEVGEGSLVIRERHRVALERAVIAVRAAMEWLDGPEDDIDLAAEELRSAVDALDSLVGRIDVEDVLGEIFSRFCLGK